VIAAAPALRTLPEADAHRDEPQIHQPRHPPIASFDEIAASTEETLVLYDLAIGLTGHLDVGDVGDVIAKHLRRVVPATVVVFYIYDVDTDDLVSSHAAGTHASHLIGLRIPRGERLSGWVAANKQTIVNADPALDLGEVGRELKPRLRSCLSTPLVSGQDLIGVLTLYSANPDAFSENHRRLLEVVGRQVSLTIKHALHFERQRASDLRDRATGLPNVRHFERMLAVASANILPEDKVSVVFVTVKQPTQRHSGAAVSDLAIEAVASAIRKALRGGDLLFRYGGNELVVLLNQTDAETADLVADRIQSTTTSELANKAIHGAACITIGVATAPADGLSVGDLVEAARRRERPLTPGNSPNAVH
jgi:diguanylate cyclase (GGDEF)-like protein